MKAAGQAGDGAAVLDWLEQMKKQGLPLSATCYNSAIYSVANTGDYDVACFLWREYRLAMAPDIAGKRHLLDSEL